MPERENQEASLTLKTPPEKAIDYLIDTHFQEEDVMAFLNDFLSWEEPPNADLSRKHAPDPEVVEELIMIETEALKKARSVIRQSEVGYHDLLSFIKGEELVPVQERFRKKWEYQVKNFPHETAGSALKEVVRDTLGTLIGNAELTLDKKKDEFQGRLEGEVRSIWAYSRFLYYYFSEKLPDN